MDPIRADMIEVCDQAGPERNAMDIMVLLKEFCFQFCHIYIGRAFRFTSLATQAKIHHFINLFMIKAVELIGIREKFPQDIGPCSCGIFFISCCHV